MEFAIDVRDLRRSYGDREAVRGISFRVAAPRAEGGFRLAVSLPLGAAT